MNNCLPKNVVYDCIDLVAVPASRLKEEYELGKLDQLKHQHTQKLIRIHGAAGIIGLFLACVLMGASPIILFGALIFQFFLIIFL